MLTTEDVRNPNWSAGGQVHNWRNYINDELKEIWHTFSDIQKLAVANNADEQASNEHWD